MTDRFIKRTNERLSEQRNERTITLLTHLITHINGQQHKTEVVAYEHIS